MAGFLSGAESQLHTATTCRPNEPGFEHAPSRITRYRLARQVLRFLSEGSLAVILLLWYLCPEHVIGRTTTLLVLPGSCLESAVCSRGPG